MSRAEVLQILKAFKEKNGNEYGILTIGLFGPAARDSMSEASDIDVVVELERPDLFNLIGIKQYEAVEIVIYFYYDSVINEYERVHRKSTSR